MVSTMNDTPSPFAWFLRYLFRDMRKDVRGAIAVVLAMAALTLWAFGLTAGATLLGVLVVVLLVCNGRKVTP